MNKPSGPRKTANLSQTVHQQLNMYALAASAVGVGALALAQPSAEAKIVYTPAHVKIVHGGVNLDLNHDGITDFTINTNGLTKTFATNVLSLRQNRVWGRNQASALPARVRVGPNQAKFQKGPSPCSTSYAGPCKVMQVCYVGTLSTFCHGPWAKAKSGYLGLKFYIKGEIHFGWARLNRKAVNGRNDPFFLTGYAYETIPNYPIITGKTTGTDDVEKYDPGSGAFLTNPIPDTPQPASLGMLALGAQGVPLWRRKETQELIGQ